MASPIVARLVGTALDHESPDNKKRLLLGGETAGGLEGRAYRIVGDANPDYHLPAYLINSLTQDRLFIKIMLIKIIGLWLIPCEFNMSTL